MCYGGCNCKRCNPPDNVSESTQEAVLIERGLYEQVVEALEDMIGLAGGLNDDDAWFGERREAEKRIAVAESVLARLKENKS